MTTKIVWTAECCECTAGTLVMRFDDVALRNRWIAGHRAVTGHRPVGYLCRFEYVDYEQGPAE